MVDRLARSGFAIFLGLAIIVPLLNYHRTVPSPTLHSEVASGIFFLLAALCAVPLLPRVERVQTSFVLFAAGLLAVLCVQLALGYYEFAWFWAPWAGYLLIFLLAATIGQLAARNAKLFPFLVDRLCAAIVFASLFNAFAQMVQATGLVSSVEPLVMWPGALSRGLPICSPPGNVGQLNHANSLAWLGICGLVYFMAKRSLRSVIGALGISILLLSSAMTSARMGWLMAMVIVAWLLASRLSLGLSLRKAISAGAGLICGLVIATFVKRQFFDSMCRTSFDRITGAASGDDYSIRIDMIRQAIDVWLSSPWIGVGVGKFMASVFAMGVDLTRRQLLDAFPHNSALEILASFGLVGGILLLGCGAVWAVRAWKVRNCSPEQWPMGAGVLILLSHALLEFPLWYLYFMLLFGLMLGAATSSEHEKGTMRFPVRVVTVGLAIYGLVAASYAFVDHERAARAIWLGNVARAEQGAASEGALANLASLVPQLTLFRIVGERELDQFLKLSADDERVRSSNERMLRNIPDPPTIYRQILIESYDGRPDKARQLIRRLLVFWPKLSDAYLEQLHERVREEPIALKALGPILDEEMIERPDAKATATHRGIWFGD